MAPLKLVVGVVVIFYLVLNILVTGYIFNCSGSLISPTELQITRIKAAKRIFKREPRVKEEPEYFVKITSCYNAWSIKRENRIIISEAVIRDYSIEELASIIGHEFGHLESWQERRHWKIDAIAVELAGKSAALKQTNKLISGANNMFNNHQVLAYIFPFACLNYYSMIGNLRSRLQKIESIPD
ncbi:MAG: M48 family metalloprotease [bacterium]|nr:M48 family metalloprotease [bacterium]